MAHNLRHHRSKAILRGKTATTALEAERATVTTQGIDRRPRDRFAADLPLTLEQEQVLAVLDGLTRPGDVARRLGRSRDGVVASLYALQDRSLVERVQYRGWRRVDVR